MSVPRTGKERTVLLGVINSHLEREGVLELSVYELYALQVFYSTIFQQIFTAYLLCASDQSDK